MKQYGSGLNVHDEQWSYVGSRSNQRWIWSAVDHGTHTLLAYVFGQRKEVVFKELKALLDSLGIHRYYTDDWGLMSAIERWKRHLPPKKKQVPKPVELNING